MASRVTLFQFYCREGGGRRSDALAAVFLGDANQELLARALALRAHAVLGDMCPPPDALRVDTSDAVFNGVMTAARELGWLQVTAATLENINKEALERIMVALSTEQSTFARWKEFLEVGVNPAMAPRPGYDAERAERKELQHPTFGTGMFSPWDAYAEERGLFDSFQPYNGLSWREMSGSDDLRIKVLPWARPV